jgi:hypothetical protein
MKKHRIILFVFGMLISVSGSGAQTLDWQAVKKLAPTTPILVTTQKRSHCNFEGATSDKLFCTHIPVNSLPFKKYQLSELVFNRADIRDVHVEPFDWSAGYLNLILGAGGGGGLDSVHQPTSFAGVKIGGALTLDLQYDRIQGKNGFSTEASSALPMFRVPGPGMNEDKMFVRVYAEPGVGYRAGGGAFGGYSSAKVLLIFFSVPKWGDTSPYIEFQRRFPFDSPLQGDNRLTIGVMATICQSCGVD